METGAPSVGVASAAEATVVQSFDGPSAASAPAPPSTDAAPQGDTTLQAPVPAAATAFAKKSRNRGHIRKRHTDEVGPSDATEGDGSSIASDIMRRAKLPKADAPLAFTTRKAGDGRAAQFQFESSRTLQQATDQGATAALETETAFDRDARALREQVLAQAGPEAAEGAPSDGMYHGLNNYTDYKKGFRREHTIGAEKGGGLHGPLRANVHARVSVRFDYQPDVCKDYKETGFCGYGDACKFVHDRSDYKSGWEIEREWNEQEKSKRKKMLEEWNPDADPAATALAAAAAAAAAASEEEEDDELPFACFICRRRWEDVQDPVVTRCKHYFCEQCALKQNVKKGGGGRCAVCETPTNGIFNVAVDIEKRLKEQKRKEAAVAVNFE